MEYKLITELAYTYIGLVTTMTKHYVDEGVPLIFNSSIKVNGIDTSKPVFLDREFAEKNKNRKHKKNDVVTVHTGDIGVSAVISDELDGSLGFATIVTRINDCNILLPEYLCAYLNYGGGKEQLYKYSRDARNNLNLADYNKLVVPLPEIERQYEIVDLVRKLKQVIANRKQELQALDKLIKARFVELFGDPKLNEKGWRTGVVSKYYEVKGGKRIPKGMGYADKVTNHPYLRATDMKNETIIDDDIHYIEDDVFEHIKRYTVKGGDIYLTNVGVNLGMAGVIPDKYDGANLTENAVKLVPKTEKVIDGLFLAHYINSPGIQDYINERKMSVGVPKLAIFRIETMPLLLPPMDLQQQFIEFARQVDKSKVAVQAALEKAQLLFDSLMQEHFG